MAGSGVRSLRYWLESSVDYLWTNEGNYQLSSLLKKNLADAIATGNCHLTHYDAHRLFFQCFQNKDYYDLVDVDCFGSASPYLSTMLWATKIGGLMYLTSTDGKTLTGHLPTKGLKAYGIYPRNHPACQEQALRILIGAVQQQAATKNLGIEPIFSLYNRATYRIMVRLLAKPNCTLENYGFLGFCHQCGNYRPIFWHKLGKVKCSCGQSLTVSGAMWLGNLHNQEFLQQMKQLAQKWNWLWLTPLLDIMLAEANLPPYFYTLAEIGKRGCINIPQRSQLIRALQNAGYQATITHINPEAIKTNCSFSFCLDLARKIAKKSPT